jgi:transcriptional regulator with XRE-family HTH domain
MQSDTEHDEALLKAHSLHAGVFRRVADKLGVDPSYVSRVAAGKREEPRFNSLSWTNFARYNAAYAASVDKIRFSNLI